jgi:ATP-dependent RNA helicase DeaD
MGGPFFLPAPPVKGQFPFVQMLEEEKIQTPAPDTAKPRRPRRRRAAKPAEAAVTPISIDTPSAVDAPDDLCFGEIELDECVLRAIRELGYSQPTPIQAAVIPLLLQGRDLVGQAQTGTGKTAAFGIPIALQVDPESRRTQALVLVPTRELAMQVGRDLEALGRYSGFTVAVLYGGSPIARQLRVLEQGAQVVVGTPGRVMDHMQRQTLDLSQINFAVLDEADEMLDIGFADDMEWILRHTPRSRQTALFSATIPGFIRRLIYRYLREPEHIHVNPAELTVDEIEQVYFEVSERDKLDALRWLLEQHDSEDRYLIFRRMQRGVDSLALALDSAGYPVRGLHGGLRQEERTRIMSAFRAGELPILVATNVAARGLDISGITHVVNFDMPDNAEEYVHRIGRTGRAGRKGMAITFAGEWDLQAIDAIAELMGDRIEKRTLPLYDQEQVV